MDGSWWVVSLALNKVNSGGVELGLGSVREARGELEARGIRCALHEPLANRTTYRVGGSADLYVEPDSEAELCAALDVLAAHDIPVTVLGGGSNVLVSDDGIRGAVLSLGEGFNFIEFDGSTVTLGATCPLARVVARSRELGLAGLAFAAGIPGTVGGAVAMNAGSRTEWIGSLVLSVSLVQIPAGGPSSSAAAVEVVGSDQVEWGYRSTSLRDRSVVTRVILKLNASSSEDVAADIDAAVSRRRATQPAGVANAGSAFRNPPGDSAGRLIEASGLKGFSIGGAEVSPVHANFVVAHPGATATDIYNVLVHVQREVEERFGVELTPEIRLVGRF